jgi:large subunit ribosomal protein L27
MAHKKSGGSSRNGRDSRGQRMGLKASGGQFLTAGSIIVLQYCTDFFPGENAGMGKDHTIFAKVSGRVQYARRRNRRLVNVIPEA